MEIGENKSLLGIRVLVKQLFVPFFEGVVIKETKSMVFVEGHSILPIKRGRWCYREDVEEILD